MKKIEDFANFWLSSVILGCSSPTITFKYRKMAWKIFERWSNLHTVWFIKTPQFETPKTMKLHKDMWILAYGYPESIYKINLLYNRSLNCCIFIHPIVEDDLRSISCNRIAFTIHSLTSYKQTYFTIFVQCGP